MIFGRQLGPPAVLDHDGLVRLDDGGRARDLVTGRERLARVDGRAMPLPLEKNRARRAGAGSFPRVVFCGRSLKRAPPPTASTDTASSTSDLVRSMKPKRALCARSKAPFIFRNVISNRLRSRVLSRSTL